jgi:glycine/D-amino acid oxidase-like deaminating enzyme
MNSDLPATVPTLVIGAGVHGLSTAWHLAQQGRQVLVIDKTWRPAPPASPAA